MKDQLTKSAWLKHGLRTLANEGPHGLKVVPMAEALKVSRGSFYWHFRDIGDFRSQLLKSWQEHTTDQVIRDLETESAEPERVKHLMRRGFIGQRKLEQAVRAWATDDGAVARAVAAVDARRIAYIAKLLTAAGVESRKALSRAMFLYWAYLGQTSIMDPRYASISAPAMDDISALFER